MQMFYFSDFMVISSVHELVVKNKWLQLCELLRIITLSIYNTLWLAHMTLYSLLAQCYRYVDQVERIEFIWNAVQ